jgi:hypothetical protein
MSDFQPKIGHFWKSLLVVVGPEAAAVFRLIAALVNWQVRCQQSRMFLISLFNCCRDQIPTDALNSEIVRELSAHLADEKY